MKKSNKKVPNNLLVYLIFCIFSAVSIIFSIITIYFSIRGIEVLEEQAKLWINFEFILSTLSLAVFIFFLTQIFNEFLEIKKRDFHSKEQNKRQQQILNSLESLKNEISLAMEGHLEEFRKNPIQIPSYFLPKINAFFYVSKLNSKIRISISKEEYKDTYILKQILIKLENKIDNINRLLELIQTSDIFSQINKRDELIKELIKPDGYYAHLESLLNSLTKEWKKLGGYYIKEE